MPTAGHSTASPSFPVPFCSVLSPGVVWELYEYVIGRPPVAAQPARSSFQLQARALKLGGGRLLVAGW